MQRDRVIFGCGALWTVGGGGGGAVRQAPRGHALPDARVDAGARHFEPSQLPQREGGDVQQAAVGAAQLLEQHLRQGEGGQMPAMTTRRVYDVGRLDGSRGGFNYLSGGHVLERHPAADELTCYDA